jgi:hypothetical protein
MFAPPTAAVFVKVTTPVPVKLKMPEGRVTVNGLGVMETVARVATPVPDIATGEPVTVAPV